MQARRVQARDTRGRRIPNLLRRGDQFIVTWKQDGQQRTKNLSARNITEAKREKDRFLAAVREGRVAAPSAFTFERAFSDYQDSRVLSERTLDHERYILDSHLAALKNRRLQTITASELARLLRQLRGRYAERTCGQVYQALAGTFALAVRREHLTRSPMDGLAPSERPRHRNARQVARLGPADLGRLVGSGATTRWQVALALAAYAGLRLGELRGLRWDDVDFASGVVRVRRSLARDGSIQAPKTEAGLRDIPLLPPLRQLLVTWKLEATHSLATDFVISTGNARPMQERNLRRALDAAKSRARLDTSDERLSWHSLRHSYASMLATDLDLPATTLAQIVGHTDAGFTLRKYARDTRSTEAVVADVLDRARKAGIGS